MTFSNAIKTALCGAAAMLPATGAWALAPAAVNALTPANILYVSGSTATDNAIQAYFKLDPAVDSQAPCTAGSYDLYKDVSGYVLTCTAGPVFGAFAGTSFAIVKQTSGGSAVGVHNVASNVAAPAFPNLATPATFTASCGAAAATGASSPFQAFNTYTCTLAEASILPNAGISDEDPTTFIGTGGVTSTDANSLTALNGVQVPFGVIVSTSLRNRLQVAEGLTSGSDTLANVPSLSSPQLRAILSGQQISLADLWVLNPTTNNLTQVDSSNSLVHICRRGDTSGSQFAANIYFFGKGCSKGNGVNSIATPDVTTSQADGDVWTGSAAQVDSFVFAGAGTGDVRTCTSFTGLATGDTVAYRIGFVGMDQAVVAATGYRFIAIDGRLPTIWNIQLGLYDFITEDTFNSNATSLARNGGAGNHATIFNTLQAHISNVNALSGLNAASRNSAAPADVTGAADTGLVTLGNTAIAFPAGPSASAGWPAAIRAINVVGQGPNSTVSKTVGGVVNNCNGIYQRNPIG